MSKYKFNHGFCIIRCQPYHIGHDRLVQEMLKDCANVSIVIGSMQESGTDKNPLPYHSRKKMIQNVYRNNEDYKRIRILGVKDTHNFTWAEKIIEKIQEESPSLNAPDVFYAGEENDYRWFRDVVPSFVLCSRNSQNFPFLTGNIVRDMIFYKYDGWKAFVHEVNHELIEKSFYEDN